MTLLTYYKRRNPFELDSIFDHFFNDVSNSAHHFHYSPSLDVQSTNNEVRVTADLPGLNKKDINIEYKDSILTISGEKIIEKNNDVTHYSERHSGKFSRSFEVGDIKFDQSKASYDNGVLEVILPKSDEQKPKFLSIK